MLGGGFQLDSSLSYHSGDNEGIEGDLDIVVPLLNLGRHVLFAQPGAVFWTGIEEEERIDSNIGLVYRAELTRNLVAGASVFYDHDFQIGHSRVSGGVDLQSGFFRLGANYYHPLSEIEDGREGFVEEALRGGDLQFAFERDVVRLGSTIGYWEYDGGEDVEDEWKTSFGLDFGVRILPGVFAEANWERHKDDVVLDERIFAGLAFKFSLPNFEGASYGDGSMSANLYKIVDREKRILYEERVAGPRVSIVRTGSEIVEEGGTIAVDVRLSEILAEDVTINLVGSGSATYGANGDWVVDNGSGDCDSVEGTDCQVVIAAGQLSPSGDVEITINDDGRTNELDENIILSMVIASTGDRNLTALGSVALTIPADPPLPTVSLSADTNSVTEGNTATITLTLSERLGSDATFNLIGVGATADVTYGASNDWNLDVGGTNCDMASESNLCQVTISQGNTTAEVVVEANVDIAEPAEDFTVSVVVDSGSIALVTPGSSSSLDFTIEGAPTVSLNYSGTTTLPTTLGIVRALIELSEPIRDSAVTVNIVGTGSSATYDSNEASGTWAVFHKAVPEGMQPPAAFTSGTACPSVTAPNGCEITIAAGQTYVDLELTSSFISSGNNIVFTLGVASASENLVRLGSSFTHTLTTE